MVSVVVSSVGDREFESRSDQTKRYNIGICCFSSKHASVTFQWDDDEIHIVLDQHAELDFYSAIWLKQQSADRHIAPMGHIILIPSHPVFALSF
jgi:hypothetical protein